MVLYLLVDSTGTIHEEPEGRYGRGPSKYGGYGLKIVVGKLPRCPINGMILFTHFTLCPYMLLHLLAAVMTVQRTALPLVLVLVELQGK